MVLGARELSCWSNIWVSSSEDFLQWPCLFFGGEEGALRAGLDGSAPVGGGSRLGALVLDAVVSEMVAFFLLFALVLVIFCCTLLALGAFIVPIFFALPLAFLSFFASIFEGTMLIGFALAHKTNG